MKIAVVSRGDASAGGASRVAEDVVREMRARGHEASHFSAWSREGFGNGRVSLYGGRPGWDVLTFAHKASRRIGFGELPPFEMAAGAVGKLAAFDVVHFHDTSDTLSPITLAAVARRVPTAWTFHDCSPFTGGCIYPQMAGCERYKVSCGECPLTREWPINGWLDNTPRALDARRKALRSGRITTLAPSAWMADEAFASGNLPARPEVVSNMIDTVAFDVASDRAALRRKLGLPLDRPVFSISAGNVADRRKGIAEALAACRNAAGVKPWVVLIGKPDPRVHEHLGGLEFTATGFVHQRRELAEWLAASDAFFATAKADNQPLAVMEALACGTPVYGWPTGGVPEMVEDGVNGRMLASCDPVDLGTALAADLASGRMATMRAASRASAVENFSAVRFADAHERLYLEMLEGTKP